MLPSPDTAITLGKRAGVKHPMKINDVPQSGSVAGVTSSRNRSGQYRRTRAIPVNPNSPAQSSVRGNLATNAAAWRTITSDQQAGWEAYAALHPRVNSIGVTYQLTGMQAYVGVNSELANLGVAAVADAPTSDVPVAPVISVDVATPTNTLDVTYAVSPIPAGMKLAFFVSKPKSKGVRFNSDFRFGGFLPAAADEPMHLGPFVVASFGNITDTQRYFVKAKYVADDGQSGPWSNVLIVDPAV